MGAVDLHPGEPGLLGQAGAGGEALDDVLDVVFGHGLGFGEHLGKTAHIQRNSRGCQRLLTEVGHGLAARMAELYPEVHTFGPGYVGPFTKTGQVLLVFQRDTARAGHGAAVDHHVTGQQ